MRFAYPLFCMHGKARERRRLIWRCLTIATQNHLLNEEIREPEVRLISDAERLLAGHNAELLAFFTDQANFRFADLFVEQMILCSDR